MSHSILDLITERQAVVAAAIATLREQISELTDELRTAEIELNDLATTRTTLTRLTATGEPPAPDGPPDTTVYQQILAAFTTGNGGAMRAKDVCHALGIGAELKDTEGIRAKLKRLVGLRLEDIDWRRGEIIVRARATGTNAYRAAVHGPRLRRVSARSRPGPPGAAGWVDPRRPETHRPASPH